MVEAARRGRARVEGAARGASGAGGRAEPYGVDDSALKTSI